MADAVGRKRTVTLSSALIASFGLAAAFAPSFVWLVAARFMVGIGIGGMPAAFALNTEFLPEAHRSRCGFLIWGLWGLGSVLEAGLAWLLVPTLGWRWLVAVSSTTTWLICLASFWAPESPGWLAAQGRHAEAAAVVRQVRGSARIYHACEFLPRRIAVKFSEERLLT
jgi:MFS family permease